jgi:transcription-repair coupling factor (superfamily II helicase)
LILGSDNDRSRGQHLPEPSIVPDVQRIRRLPSARKGKFRIMLNAEPEGLLAARLIERAAAAGSAGVVFVARSEQRASRLHHAVRALAPPATEVLLLPGWDCLPYDRVFPSRDIMGQRMALATALLAGGGAARLLVASVEAMSQRLPRPDAGACLHLQANGPIEPEVLRRRLLRLGYVLDERVDEPGEAVIHGGVVDLYPAWAPGNPAWRLRHEAGRIEEIHRFDILTQRSLEQQETAISLGPASELILPEDDPLVEARPPGLEHALPAYAGDLIAPLSLLPDAEVVLDCDAEAVLTQRRAEVAEAFRTRIALRPPQPEEPPVPPPDALHLDEAAWMATLEEPLGNLLALARLSIRCRGPGIARLEVGPSAVAATPRTVPEAPPPLLDLKNGRLLLRCESSRAEERLAAVAAPA